MPDTFKEVTRTGYGGRIIKSLKGVVLGVILFFGSFGILYWNEGRVDLSLIAKTAVEIQSDKSADAAMDGKFVSTTGTFATDETLGDNLYLKPGKYIAVEREVEMYAWVEHKSEKTTTKTGGSEETETTYDYKKEWTPDPKASSDFKHPEGHLNSQMTLKGETFKVNNAKVGIYPVDMKSVDLPSFSKLSLTNETVKVSGRAKLTNSEYVFIGIGSLENPEIGDMRISYSAVNSGIKATVFGKLDGASISPYVDPDNNTLYRVFEGTRDQAISTLHTEYVVIMWILRLLGFIMMWIGLALLFEPVSVLFDVLPVLGSLSRSLVGVATFLVALVLSIVTILVSMVLHSVIALVISLAVAVIAIIVVLRMVKKKKVTHAT